MKTFLFECVQKKDNPGNWGKFLVGLTDHEWAMQSQVDTLSQPRSILGARGWSPTDILVLDIETCEGAIFSPSGFAPADLVKHRIWVCPLFEHFLTWLYAQLEPMDPAGWVAWFETVPKVVELPDAPFELRGYRRPGRRARRSTLNAD